MEKIVHRSITRGFADHGWLKSHHTFSFADYMDPARMNFGALRVLNDDTVAPGMGFGTHPHANMEIISIPIQGTLAHKDSTGKSEDIRSGDVQIMSAGTGLTHSEFNPDQTQAVNFLQIWILPDQMQIKPRYEQKTFDLESHRGKFVKLISWQKEQGVMWINQRAQFWQGLFDAGTSASVALSTPGSGFYIFVIDGEIEIAGETLQARDAIGLTGKEQVDIRIKSDARILAIEVPGV
jgi:quercetin 2,3-dioxygenase